MEGRSNRTTVVPDRRRASCACPTRTPRIAVRVSFRVANVPDAGNAPDPLVSALPSYDGGERISWTRGPELMKSRFYYAGIRVRDLDRSLRFYQKAFGLKIIGRGRMPHGGLYVHLRGPGSSQRLELNWYPKGSRFYTPYRRGEELDHLAFVVEDVEKAYKALLRLGAKPAVPPSKSTGTEVYVKDPDGIWLELLG